MLKLLISQFLRMMLHNIILFADDGVADLGTGVVQSEGVQGEAGTEPVVQNDNPTISVAEAMKLKEDNQRLSEYAEFIKQSAAAGRPPVNPVQRNVLPKDAVPFVEDVEAIIEDRVAQFKQEMENEIVIRDLTSLSASMRASDPDFDRRMQLASEYVEHDEFAQHQFDKARTAQEKIAVLEKVAKFHPLFGNSPAQAANPVNDAVARLQRNAQIPATVNNMAIAGGGRKSVMDMDDKEYNDFFKSVVKQAY